MSPTPRSSSAPRRTGGGRSRGASPPSDLSPTDIQDAYMRRAIAEMGALNDDIAACPRCQPDGALPVMSSGSPQAQIMLIKWSPGLSERQEGVAFFGRAGTAILKSVQRLGIDPLELYGTLCVKCTHQDPQRAAERCPAWLTRELQVVMPRMIVPMGPRALAAVNGLGFPLAAPLREETGVVQRFTPSIEAIYVPDIDASLDEQGAKRAFWEAFRALGEWHEAQPPY